jgi:hypothetical protein
MRKLHNWFFMFSWAKGEIIVQVATDEIKTSMLKAIRQTDEGTFVETQNSVYQLETPKAQAYEHLVEYDSSVRNALKKLGFKLPKGIRWSSHPTVGITDDGIRWHMERSGKGWKCHAVEDVPTLAMYNEVEAKTATAAKDAVLKIMRERMAGLQGKALCLRDF